jgi:cyanophycin synthetase
LKILLFFAPPTCSLRGISLSYLLMKILQTQTLRGPNYWSIRRSKLIVLRLDLEELADRPSSTIEGFPERLAAVLPSLVEHFCSPGCRGGFLQRVQEGTMLGHILEHVALELQNLAGMDVGFGRTRETTTPGIYQVVFEYEIEEVGRYAARAALRLCQSIVDTGTYPQSEFNKDLADLVELRTKASLGATTEALVQEAAIRGIPCLPLETCDLLQLGYGKYQKRVQAALTSHSNILGVEIACNKEKTKNILASMGVPVPLGEVIYSYHELVDAIQRIGGFPIVIKPLNGNHGRGITIDICSWETAEIAYDRARDVSKGVIVEHFYQGRDHRILVVNHQVVAVAERVPAHVVGDGLQTITALVQQENQDPRRGEGHDNLLTTIQIDESTMEMLSRQGYTLDTVLPAAQICYLRATANLSTGGIAIDRTDEIHPETIWLAERVSRIIDLDVVGIDVVTTDISQTLAEANGVIVEVNAAPGLRMHIAPSVGVGRNVAAPILNMLFPPGSPTRIPIVAKLLLLA